MPTPIPPGLGLGVVEPVEAVEAFQARQLLEITFSWQDLWNEEHTRAFTVSRLTSERLLEFMRDELGKAVSNGTRLEDFRKAVMPRLISAGWWGKRTVVDTATGEKVNTTFDPSRLELIYSVNTRQSYAAGRWARIERTKDRFPFIMYRTMRDERVRLSHRPWDGLVLPVDHKFWETHFPPNGWRCRCTAFAVDERTIERYRRQGFAIKTTAPREEWVTFTNRRTGEVSKVPRGVDPGFAYNAGRRAGAT